MYSMSIVKLCIFFIITIKITSDDVNAQDDGLDHLRKNIPGEPGKDYPINSFNIVCKLNPRQCGGGGGLDLVQHVVGDGEAVVLQGVHLQLDPLQL